MLRIRREQLEAFAQTERERFIVQLAEHLRTFFPHEVRALGDEGVRQRIEDGIASARKYGIISERGVCHYVDAAMLLGAGFEQAHPWVVQLLRDDSLLKPDARARQLLHRALEWAQLRSS